MQTSSIEDVGFRVLTVAGNHLIWGAIRDNCWGSCRNYIGHPFISVEPPVSSVLLMSGLQHSSQAQVTLGLQVQKTASPRRSKPTRR